MTIAKLTISAGLAAAILVATAQGKEGPIGYLQPGTFDIMAVLPPAPRIGDPRDKADRAIFRATRKLAGTPRWDLATNDVKLNPVDLARDYSCALGVTLTPENAPRTVSLIKRVSVDTNRGTVTAKNTNQRRRPFLADRGGVCQPISELKDSYDYPSGHTTRGWTWAMMLAELAPDRATPILARGRAFGDSRMVCGAHNRSAVDAGYLSATVTLTAIATDPTFVADRDAARVELDALRHDPATPKPAAVGCAREAALVAQRLY